jgi:CRP-like cAMP-binding protein
MDAASQILHHRLLADLPLEERERIVALSAVQAAGKGTVLFREGEPAASLFLLESGRVKLTQTAAAGQDVILRYMGPGEIFAAVALVGAPYPANAFTTERSRLRTWSGPALGILSREHPIFAANVLRAVSSHTREALSRVRELATEAVPQRLARTLLRLARQIGRRADDGSVSLERITQQELAEIAGTTLYTVSRTLTDWSTAGIVETGRQAVRILSPGRLEEIGESSAAG